MAGESPLNALPLHRVFEISHRVTIATITIDMTRLGFCEHLCDKVGIRHR